MDKHRFNWVLISFIFLSLAGILIAANFYIGGGGKSSVTKTIPPIFADVEPGPKISTILAPNGKMSLVVKEEKGKDGTLTETFSTQTDAQGAVQIYTEVLPAGSTISVPYNTFSPDNKYVFLKKTTETGTIYFVLKTDGTVFKNNEKTIDFVSLFDEKYPDLKASDVTGWGGMTLIVINVDKPDGTVEHSYWYDVSSNSFIALSTKFN